MDNSTKSDTITSDTTVKEVAAALNESLIKYKILVESSPDCIKFFDLKGNLTFINEGGKKEHYLKTEEDVKNFKPIDSVIEEDRPKFIKAFEEAKRGISSEIEIRHTNEGADRDVCLETITPIRDHMQNVIGILGVSRDLTERKKTERKLKDEYDEKNKLYKLTIGRELNMIDLKKRIVELEAKSPDNNTSKN
jgi:PAS domain S-box-containing protein